MKKFCVITGSRAEYDLLYRVMKEIEADADLELQIIATGMHLSPEFGLTYKQIESDGFCIDRKVESLLSSDSAVGVAKSMGLGISSIADALQQLQPDIVVVLGDRFEIMAAAQAAMVLNIPLAHIAGGDIGSGTYDNTIRHCITKMASLHFVTHEEARRRVIQLGESPDRVFCFGSTSVDNILTTPLLTPGEVEERLGIKLSQPNFLVTHHPLTMDNSSASNELQELFSALDQVRKESGCSVIFTRSNADNGGRELNRMIEQYVAGVQGAYLFDSLGRLLYLSTLRACSVLVGNSSSGIYEAPYLNTPTVDIGSRQKGRAAPGSVFRCQAQASDIYRSIRQALDYKFADVRMIYGDGNAAVNICRKLKELSANRDLAIKVFHDVPHCS